MAQVRFVNQCTDANPESVDIALSIFRRNASYVPVNARLTFIITKRGNIVFPITQRFARRVARDAKFGGLVSELIEFASNYHIERTRPGGSE